MKALTLLDPDMVYGNDDDTLPDVMLSLTVSGFLQVKVLAAVPTARQADERRCRFDVVICRNMDSGSKGPRVAIAQPSGIHALVDALMTHRLLAASFATARWWAMKDIGRVDHGSSLCAWR